MLFLWNYCIVYRLKIVSKDMKLRVTIIFCFIIIPSPYVMLCYYNIYIYYIYILASMFKDITLIVKVVKSGLHGGLAGFQI